MAKTTPARITYMLGDSEQVIRFHSVVSEGHQASSEVTKFPVQSGFQVSNHSIRHNRKVVIEAIISNSLIVGGDTSYQYSSTDNSKTIFKALTDLVNLKISTTVLTNLGIYTPVIFTSFKTKQMVGMVDSMKFILSGEEVQESFALNGAAPSPVSWKTMPRASALARADDLRAAGVDISESAAESEGFFQEATINLGEDFSIDGVDSLGIPRVTTYINKGIDPATGSYTYEIHSTDQGIYVDPAKVVSGESTPTDLLSKTNTGIRNPVGCLIHGGAKIAEEAAEDYIDTAMGRLKKTAYGALYGVINMSGNDIGQAMIGMSVGCIIRGITGHADNFPYLPGESLPTARDVVEGAIDYGKKVQSGSTVTASGVVSTLTTLTRF